MPLTLSTLPSRPSSLPVDVSSPLRSSILFPLSSCFSSLNLCVLDSLVTFSSDPKDYLMTASRREEALTHISTFLTFQNLPIWSRAIARAVEVGPSELCYYCACALIRKSVTDIQTTPEIFTMVIEELNNGIKKMYIPHIQALCQSICNQYFETMDPRFAGVKFISLTARTAASDDNTILLDPSEQHMIISIFLSYFNNLKSEYEKNEVNGSSSSSSGGNGSSVDNGIAVGSRSKSASSNATASSFSYQDSVEMISFLTDCLTTHR